jgi:Uma2 family endonuclease
MTEVAAPVAVGQSATVGEVQVETEPTPTPGLTFPVVLHMPDTLQMNDDQFLAFCRQNESLRIERNAEGDLIIMPPAGGETSNRNFRLTVSFGNWVEQDGRGEGFDSSGGFRLPNGVERSPDLAWVARERLEGLTVEQTDRFLPLCPDFVVEIRSPSDGVAPLQEKMQEYIENGAQLGWLIDPANRQVHVYRPDAPAEMLDNPAALHGEPLLPGFTLDVQAIFNRRLGRGR